MQAYERVKAFLTSELDEDVSLDSRPGCSARKKEPRYQLDRRLGEPQSYAPEQVWALWRTEESCTEANGVPIIQPVA
jgi:hypothetical protein